MSTGAAPAGQLVERLEKEIRHRRNWLGSCISNRRLHPTYGYTKAMISHELYRLEGAIAAWALVTGRWPHAGSPFATESLAADVVAAAREALEIDLARLHELVKQA